MPHIFFSSACPACRPGICRQRFIVSRARAFDIRFVLWEFTIAVSARVYCRFAACFATLAHAGRAVAAVVGAVVDARHSHRIVSFATTHFLVDAIGACCVARCARKQLSTPSILGGCAHRVLLFCDGAACLLARGNPALQHPLRCGFSSRSGD